MAPPLGSGRREADQLLLLLLRKNGCSVPEGLSLVAHMTSDMVIEVVASLIPAIDGSPPFPDAFSTRGLHPAERHRTCKIIASRVKDAGYAEPLSPHQLLYPGEGGTRRLLLALISMLPPDGAPPNSSRYTASASHAPVPGTTGEQAPVMAHDLLSGGGRTVDDTPADDASVDGYGGRGRSGSSAPVTSAEMEVGNTGVERSDNGQGSGNEGEEIVTEASPGESGKQGVEDDGRGEDDSADDESESAAEVAAETAATTEIEADVRTEVQNADETLAHMGPRDFHVTAAEDAGGEMKSVADGVEASGMDLSSPAARQISPGNPVGIQATSIGVPTDVTVLEILPESTTPIDGWEGVGSSRRSEMLDEAVKAEDEGDEDENIFQQDLLLSALKVKHHGEFPDNDPPARELSSKVPTGGEQRADEETICAGSAHWPKADEKALGAGKLYIFCAQDEGLKEAQAVEVGSGVQPATPEIPSHLSQYSQNDGTIIAPIDAADRETELSATESVAAVVAADSTRKQSGNGCSSGFSQLMSDYLRHVDGSVAQKPEGADEEHPVKEADPEAEPSIVEAHYDDKQVDDKPENGIVRTGDHAEEGFHCHRVVEIAEVGSPAVGSQGEKAEARDAVGGVEAGTSERQNEDYADDNAVAEEEGDDDIIFLQFAVEAQEVELQRLVTEKDAVSADADELEEEVRRLGVLTAERERECRYSATALELLPRAGDERGELQRQCSAAEARIQAARNAFDRLRKPLEEVVRAQREELARRKVRCRSLLSEIRSKYEECENMARSESCLRAAALEMEAWETQGHSNEPFLIGGTDVEGEPDWEDRGEDDEVARRRRAGALLRADLDARIGSLSEEALGHKQEVAISVSEVLDSRRETNAAWEGLGRTEALAEEKLFAVAKEASTGGGSKERGKDFIQAYKHLHVLQDLFSRLVEAVAEAGKHEEEGHVVEDGTEVLLSEGEAAHSELLMRDLRRVQGDVFALERRLDDALEEERQLRQAFEADRQMQEEQELRRQASLEAETGEKQQDEQNEAPERWHGSDNGSQAGVLLSDNDSAEGWSSGRDGEDGASKEADEVGAVQEEGRLEDIQSVDFVGEDEDDNFWQQIDIPQAERIGVVESADPVVKPETG